MSKQNKKSKEISGNSAPLPPISPAEEPETKPAVIDDKPAELTEKEELFCRYFTQNEILRGNATLSYAEAYGHDLDKASEHDAVYEEIEVDGEKIRKLVRESTYTRMYNGCSGNASRLRRKDKIQRRIVALRNEFLRDDVVDSELAQVIMAPVSDVKMRGIAEYNKIKKRTGGDDNGLRPINQNFFTLFIQAANSRIPVPVDHTVVQPEVQQTREIPNATPKLDTKELVKGLIT